MLLVVNYGVGLDSTAMLVEMHRRGMRPDLILFSDTGGEKPETYAYLPIINAWLISVGFPTVTVVRFAPVRAPYTTLEGKCLANETLPSITFGGHSCALVFKRDVMNKYLKSWAPAKAAVACGEKIVKAIGYDDSKADRKRRRKADLSTHQIQLKVLDRASCGKAPLADQWEIAHCTFSYYLQDWGLERDQLAAIILAAGLPLPVKSACFFWRRVAARRGRAVAHRSSRPVLARGRDGAQRARWSSRPDPKDGSRDRRLGMGMAGGLRSAGRCARASASARRQGEGGVAAVSLYVVKQRPVNGSWEHYLCGWWGRYNDIPVLLSDRSQALKLDAKEAAECVKRLDTRYRYPASGLRHSVEELLDD